MKKTITSILLAMCLTLTYTFGGVTAKHTADDPAKKPVGAPLQVAVIPTASANVINVYVDKAAGRPVAVRVLSESGIELSCQYIQKRAEKGYLKFNLEALADGKYKVEVSDGQTKTEHPFTLSTKEPVAVNRTISLY